MEPCRPTPASSALYTIKLSSNAYELRQCELLYVPAALSQHPEKMTRRQCREQSRVSYLRQMKKIGCSGCLWFLLLEAQPLVIRLVHSNHGWKDKASEVRTICGSK